MLTIKNVLVAYDFSDSANQALHYAVRLAHSGQAVTLHVLHVEVLHEDSGLSGGGTEGNADRLRARLEQTMNALLVDAGADAPVVEYAVGRDVAAGPAILRYVESHNIDLVVLGTHGRRRLGRLLLGSVAEEVMLMAPCPVLTIRNVAVDEQDALRTPRSILVPVDFSEHARLALWHARALAADFDARLILVHVLEERMHPAFYNTGAFSIYDLQPDIEEKARRQLERFYEQSDGPSGTGVTYIIQPGHAAREIVRVAEQEGAEMIVMASHGLTGLDHFFIGSVAEKVLRRAPCPVFAIKAFGKMLVSTSVRPESATAT